MEQEPAHNSPSMLEAQGHKDHGHSTTSELNPQTPRTPGHQSPAPLTPHARTRRAELTMPFNPSTINSQRYKAPGHKPTSEINPRWTQTPGELNPCTPRTPERGELTKLAKPQRYKARRTRSLGWPKTRTTTRRRPATTSSQTTTSTTNPRTIRPCKITALHNSRPINPRKINPSSHSSRDINPSRNPAPPTHAHSTRRPSSHTTQDP